MNREGAGQDAGEEVAFRAHHGDPEDDVEHADDDRGPSR